MQRRFSRTLLVLIVLAAVAVGDAAKHTRPEDSFLEVRSWAVDPPRSINERRVDNFPTEQRCCTELMASPASQAGSTQKLRRQRAPNSYFDIGSEYYAIPRQQGCFQRFAAVGRAQRNGTPQAETMYKVSSQR